MGYRKAAMMRRRQYVSGHYRTSKNGNTYWVEGHMRNDHKVPWDSSFAKTATRFYLGFFAFLLVIAFIASISK